VILSFPFHADILDIKKIMSLTYEKLRKSGTMKSETLKTKIRYIIEPGTNESGEIKIFRGI